MLGTVPKIPYPEQSGAAGGRPLTLEEFERIIQACKKRRGPTAASWTFLLRGLWFSGLRLSEAMALTWGERGLLTMDLESRRPMFSIQGSLSKNRKDQRFPMSPEFFEMIDSVPFVDRSGFVFNPDRNGTTGTGSGRLTAEQVGETIGRLGREAGVKVKENMKGEPVFASAHDLRRSFGFRWARRVMPPILQSLMRHKDIQTTMRFYVTQVEQQAADAVWDAMPTQNLPPIPPPPAEKYADLPVKDKKP
jgi:integrase